MLRVAEQWADSDLGRQRQGNEDSFFVRSPLFVVADGMGGAQAGEVASATAVRAFERGLPAGPPTEGLVRLITDANHAIHDRSRSDADMAGMGTTLTAAYLAEDDAVVVAHVGDSRCYLLRDGDLVRLTRDHSLVGELVARGKLTEEQAEVHPQRSVITRALGPEPHVEVDVDVFPARGGDLFLLCSDGLTSMIPEPEVKRILSDAATLERAGRELIQAANAAGGRDNITVILFRVEDVGDRRRGAAAATDHESDTGQHDTLGGGPAPGRAAAEQETQVHDGAVRTAEVRTAVRDADAGARASRERDTEPRGAVAVRPAPEDRAPVVEDRGAPVRRPVREHPGAAPRAPARRRRRRTAAKYALVTAVLLAMVLAAGWSASRAVYFVGTDPRDGRTITIFRGLPYELPFGIELYQRYAGSGVTIDAVPRANRRTFTDHRLRSRDDAEELIIALERGRLNQ